MVPNCVTHLICNLQYAYYMSTSRFWLQRKLPSCYLMTFINLHEICFWLLILRYALTSFNRQTLDLNTVTSWCSGYHYYLTSFNKAWIQALPRFKACSQRVGDSLWWGSMILAPAKRLSWANYSVKTNHHHYHHHHQLYPSIKNSTTR